MRKVAVLSALIVVSLFAFGCACQADEDMRSLATKLNSLTTAAQGYETYMKPDPAMSDQAFLEAATANDPSLLTPFADYKLDVERQDGFVSILVCTPDGSKALLQDVGCTGEFDLPLWENDEPIPCDMVPSAFSLCPQ
ncbi:hypothetical protein [Pseudodesulfovibrio sediminis]|uniref:Lipoprotein n=1 Tax=Pseudodesulfovibrio sediminis TaxID=2810563 RepID=A0ABN6ETI9_9BACT|nr:hypothetical protein [Pseudodesulfovibrio sediminis]BCS89633.1 hypothetical protein PSDVSF_28750 [Pseudodesulfovibrio sediminis]